MRVLLINLSSGEEYDKNKERGKYSSRRTGDK